MRWANRKTPTMDRENPHAASNVRAADAGGLSPDARRVLDAFIATATGTAAGILVDSGFGLRVSIVNKVFGWLGPLFDVISEFPNAQLLAAGFIYRIPVILMVGMAAGLILRYLRYPRLLFASTLVWPVCLLGRRVAAALLPPTPDHAGTAARIFSQADFVCELAMYSMQYVLLILVICSINALLTRTEQRRVAAAAQAGPGA